MRDRRMVKMKKAPVLVKMTAKVPHEAILVLQKSQTSPDLVTNNSLNQIVMQKCA